jgi:hypothetical protein
MQRAEFPKLLSEAETAELLGLQPSTLAAWRCTKRVKLAYHKVGRLVRYDLKAVQEFLLQHQHDVQQPAA